MDRNEEPTTTGDPPDWLERAWAGAKRRGLDAMTPEEIDAEIAAYQRERRMPQSRECDALKADIAVGLDDIDQGRVHEFDLDEIIAKGRRLLAVRPGSR